MRHITLSAIGLLFASAIGAQASLIGDDVTFECTNCGPPTSDTFTVVVGGPELTLFSQFEVDVEASSLRIDWIFDSDSIISDLTFVWSDLDWLPTPGKIVDAVIDASSTWPDASTLTFTDDSVTLVNGADLTVSTGDFLLINLETVHADIPVPAGLPLALSALGILGYLGRRRRAA